MFSKKKNLIKRNIIKTKDIIKRKSKKLFIRVFKFLTMKILYPIYYNCYSHKQIKEDKVVFVEVRWKQIFNSFELIYNTLKNEYTYDIYEHFLLGIYVNRIENVKRCLCLLKDMADAKYVFINDGVLVLNAIKLRKETKLIQLWHGCGAFKKFGYSTADLLFGASKNEMMKYPIHCNYSIVTVSSPETIPAYMDAMNLENRKDIIKPIGVSRSDIYFQKEFHKIAFEKLYRLLPLAKNKKVILYSPTFRGSIAKAKTPNVLNIAMFAEAFKEEYVLLIKHHPLVKQLPKIEESQKDFCMDMTSKMSIEELLCVSDICISDYSSLVFEYSLLERPMLFFPYDIEEYFDWRGFYFRYEELAPGPICKTNLELIEQIKNIDQIDLEIVRKYKERFMKSCDGNATRRILEEVFGIDSLHKYRKAEKTAINYASVTKADMTGGKSKFRANGRKIFYAFMGWYYKKRKEKSKVKDHKVIFLDGEDKKISERHLLVEEQCSLNYEVKEILLHEYTVSRKKYFINCIKAICEIAEAKRVYIYKDVRLLNALDIREETKIILYETPVFPVVKREYATMRAAAGRFTKEEKLLPKYSQVTDIYLSSWKIKSVIDEIYNGYNGKNRTIQYHCVENLYVKRQKSMEQKELVRQNLTEEYPYIKGKKIILYLPHYRGRKNKPTLPNDIDFQRFFEYLHSEYIVIIKYKNKKAKPYSFHQGYYHGFYTYAKDISIDKLFAVSDICITDYEEQCFEFAAQHKPIYYMAKDKENYFANKEVFVKYEEAVLGPIVSDTGELIELILKSDEYDYSKIENFCNHYLK